MFCNGIVSKFFDIPDQEYGILTVLDDDGQPTGQEIEFRFSDGVYPTLASECFDLFTGQDTPYLGVTWSGCDTSGVQCLAFPEPGDRIAFTGDFDTDRQQETAGIWTYVELVEDIRRRLCYEPLPWKATLRLKTSTGHTARHVCQSSNLLDEILAIDRHNLDQRLPHGVPGGGCFEISVRFPDSSWRLANKLPRLGLA